MAIRWIEVPAFIDANSNPPTETRKYKLYGTQSRFTVQSTAIASTPAIILTPNGSLYRQNIKATQFAFDAWDVEIPYESRKVETGEFTWNFDTTGGTVHITNSKDTVHGYKRSDVADNIPNFSGAIDSQPDEVKGADIVIPAMKISVGYKHPYGVVTMAYARYLQSITGLVNSTPFFNWAPGEVLFLGASGSDGTATDATVDYQFAMSTNVTDLELGGLSWINSANISTTIEKLGWDLAWILYEDGVDAANPVKKPKFVYIERVYDTVDLASSLGFG